MSGETLPLLVTVTYSKCIKEILCGIRNTYFHIELIPGIISQQLLLYVLFLCHNFRVHVLFALNYWDMNSNFGVLAMFVFVLRLSGLTHDI